MNPFLSLREYEEFVYTLRQLYPAVIGSTLTVVRRGKGTAVLRGELRLRNGYRLQVLERLDHHSGKVVIESYGYELWKNNQKQYWYDSQPHPDDPALAATFPHHKHIPPDIKHNRIPADKISFSCPNLPTIIREIEELS